MSNSINSDHDTSESKAFLEGETFANNIVSLNTQNTSTDITAPDSLGKEWIFSPENILTMICLLPPVIDYLFKNFLPTGIIAGLCGSGGLGKTILILQWAYSLATGIIVFPSIVPVKARSVMIILGEDSRDVIWRRIHNIAKRFPPSPEQQRALDDNLHLYCVPARPLCINDGGKVIPSDAYKDLQREIGRVRPDLVILDPKSRWAGTNENSNDDATTFVTMMEELVRPHGASLLVTHHIAKSGRSSTDASAVRGASALIDGMRLVYVMTESCDKGDKAIILDISKSNMTPKLEQPVMFVHSRTHGVLEEIVEFDGRSKLGGIVETLVEWFKENEPLALTSLLHARTDSAKALRELLKDRHKASKKEIADAIKLGVDEKVLVIEKVGKRGRPAEVLGTPAPAETPSNVIPFDLEEAPPLEAAVETPVLVETPEAHEANEVPVEAPEAPDAPEVMIYIPMSYGYPEMD